MGFRRDTPLSEVSVPCKVPINLLLGCQVPRQPQIPVPGASIRARGRGCAQLLPVEAGVVTSQDSFCSLNASSYCRICSRKAGTLHQSWHLSALKLLCRLEGGSHLTARREMRYAHCFLTGQPRAEGTFLSWLRHRR